MFFQENALWVFIGLLTFCLIAYVVRQVKENNEVKKNYHLSYEHMNNLYFGLNQRQNTENPVTQKISESVALKIHFFFGFVELTVYENQNGQWNQVHRSIECQRLRKNGLYRFEGKWAADLEKYLKEQYLLHQ